MKTGNVLKKWLARVAMPVAAMAASLAAHAAPLTIGYSDWPGWVAWQVAIEKGWLKEAGLDVKFQWFDYSASMDAFAAGKIDADNMTNGDALVTGSGGGKSVYLAVTDYSDGNDMIVGKPGIKSIKDLKGKKIAVEVGLVEHLLLLDGLKKAGLKESDVTLVNAKTNEIPQVFASPDIAAAGVWQPVANQVMRAVPGSRPIYTSHNEPGLIYDVLCVTPTSAKEHRDEWIKLLKVWDRVVAYINDPKTQPDAVKIMAAKSGVSPKEYLPLLKGTHLLDTKAGKKVYVKGDGFNSLYGSTKIVNEFNVDNKVYKAPEDIDAYWDPSFTQAVK
jgi:NitT/TauT family transport system substrate-binding protein